MPSIQSSSVRSSVACLVCLSVSVGRTDGHRLDLPLVAVTAALARSKTKNERSVGRSVEPSNERTHERTKGRNGRNGAEGKEAAAAVQARREETTQTRRDEVRRRLPMNAQTTRHTHPMQPGRVLRLRPSVPFSFASSFRQSQLASVAVQSSPSVGLSVCPSDP